MFALREHQQDTQHKLEGGEIGESSEAGEAGKWEQLKAVPNAIHLTHELLSLQHHNSPYSKSIFDTYGKIRS